MNYSLSFYDNILKKHNFSLEFLFFEKHLSRCKLIVFVYIP